MALQLQPDRAHDAEENSSQYSPWLLGLIDQEFPGLPNIDATQELLLQTPYQNDDHDRFESNLDLSPPRGPVEFPTRHAAEAAYNDLRLFNEQIDGQVPSTTSISDLGGPIKITTVADNAFAPTERQTTAEATHWQQIREIVLSGLIPGPTPHNVQERRERKCLKCRFEKRKCQHRTTYRADLLPATLTAYSMQVIAPDFLMMSMIDALYPLYENITALRLNSQGRLRSDGNTVSLHMVMEEHSSAAGLRDEHDVIFYPDRLRYMPRMGASTFTHRAIIEPAIDVIGFDRFISKKMWSGHDQQPELRFTQAQRSSLQTARLICGYSTLLANLDHIKIYTEYTEQYTARLTCVALVYLFAHRLCQLYQQLGYNLQTLVETEECNHYVAAQTLELIYRCLRTLNAMTWGTTNHSISQALAQIRRLLTEWVSMIVKEVQDIERDFDSPYRGDGRSTNHPTMKATKKLRLPRRLGIYFEADRLSQASTHMMLTRNGGLNTYSVPDLLSSEDIYDLPPPDQPPRGASQPALTPFNLSQFPDNGESSTSTWTTQTPQAIETHAQNTQLPPHSAQTSTATLPSTLFDVEPEDSLFLDEALAWNIAPENRAWWLEGGISNEFPDMNPPNNFA